MTLLYVGCTGSDRNVRLQDGSSCLSGRLEVCVNGQWQTVCSQFFTDTDAMVVCRELGLSERGIARVADELAQVHGSKIERGVKIF